MKKSILLAFLSVAITAFFTGCASMPRELADHKLIPGGEYSGKADNNRPAEIKYQPLPDNVQYVRASDSLVIAVYNDLKTILASDEDNVKIAKYLFLMPGTWENIQEAPELKSKFKKQKDKYKVGVGKEKFTFRYAIPRDAKSARKAWDVAKRTIRYPGWSPDAVIPDPNAPAPEAAPAPEPPAEAAPEEAAAPVETAATEEAAPAEATPVETVPAPVATIPMPKPEPAEIKIRAISTDEMDIISKFSPFKMVEPLFVVNDRYVLGFNKNGELEVLDEIPYYTPFFERFEQIMNGDD